MPSPNLVWDVEADHGETVTDECGSHELRQWIAQAADAGAGRSDDEDSQPLLGAPAPSRVARASTSMVLGPLLLLAVGGAALWARPGGASGAARSLGVGREGLAGAAVQLSEQQVIPKYEQALGCYCGRDGKIGSTWRGVGKQRCQALCDEDPQCVAFEMYKGGEDCTLRPHCPDPRKSNIGTFLVLFAHRNNGTLYPADLAMMCSKGVDDPSGLFPMMEEPAPMTAAPITAAPITAAPTTAAPATAAPATAAPATAAPTTAAPAADESPDSTTPFVPLPPDDGFGGGAGAGGVLPGGDTSSVPFFDWSKVTGGAEAAVTVESTTPLYKVQEVAADVVEVPLLSPPFGGTRVVQSETCSEAFDMLWNEGCEHSHFLWQFTRTCHADFVQEWKRACGNWYRHFIHGKEELNEAMIKECSSKVADIEEKEWLGSYAAPTSAEEAHVCFTCTSVTCIVLANYSGPPLTFDGNLQKASPTVPPIPVGHWSPDGSVNHCRPMEGSEVVGVQFRVRREVHHWTDEEWAKFEHAVAEMKRSGVYAEFATNFTRRLAPDWPEFTLLESLPWTRRFLLDFETELQRVSGDCGMTLPYWSATMEASPMAFQESIVWSPGRLGGKPVCVNGGYHCDDPAVSSSQHGCAADSSVSCLGDGLAAGWVVDGKEKGCACVHRSPSLNASLISQPTLFRYLAESFDLLSISSRMMAFTAYMTCQVAGAVSTLCNPATTVWDPLFFLIQADFDRLFLKWQRYRAYHNQIDTTDCPGCAQLMTLYGQPISDMLGNFQRMSRGQYIELPKSSPRILVTYQAAYDPDLWL